MSQKINATEKRLTRRQMLHGLSGTAAAFLLAACGSTASEAPQPTSGAAAAQPTAAVAVAPAAPTEAMAAAAEPTTAGAAATMVPTEATAAKPTPVPVPTGETGLSEAMASDGTYSGAPNLVGKLSMQEVNIAFIPAEDAAKTLSDNGELLAYLKQVFGVEIIGAVGTSYTAVIEAMRAKKVDIAFLGPFSYILGNVEANAQALVQGENKDGQLSTYTSLIITQADSPLATLADIKGKSFSFVDPASTSGHLVPSYTILQKASLSEQDYKPIYAGSHPASYQAVLNNKVDAGAIASDIYEKGITEGSIDESKIKVIDTSFPIPGSPIAIRGDIAQADQDLFLQAFLSINDQPHDGKVFKGAIGGLGSGTVKLRKADDSAYDELRKIPEAIGIDIAGLK